MRFIQPALLFVALAAASGCAHAAAPRPAMPPPVGDLRARTADDDGAVGARAIVAAKFTEPGTQVVAVTIEPTATPLIYAYVCAYRRTEFGEVCMYEAKGLVDSASGKVNGKRKVTVCMDVEAR